MGQLVGPIVSIMVNRYGCRNVSIFGSILVAIGYGLSSFARNVEILYLTIGIIGGKLYQFVDLLNLIFIL